mgnify:CR=1 FL=1
MRARAPDVVIINTSYKKREMPLVDIPIVLDFEEFALQKHIPNFASQNDFYSKHNICHQEFKLFIEDFFAEQNSLISLGYSFPSGVLLGIDNWDDIEFYFLVVFVQKIKGRDVEVLNPSRIHKLFLSKHGNFRVLCLRAFIKIVFLFVRGALRGVLGKRSSINKNVFISLWDGTGKFRDKYYGDLPSISESYSFIVFSGGKSVFLRNLGHSVAIERVIPLRSHCKIFLQQIRLLLTNHYDDCGCAKLKKYLRFKELEGGLVNTNLLGQELGNSLAFKTNRSSVLIFPFENRTWEKLLCGSLKGTLTYTVGYNHAMITSRHLALTVLGAATPKSILPDRIVSCGKLTFEKLVAFFSEKDIDMRAGPALRLSNNHLLTRKNQYIFMPTSSGIGEAKFLIKIAEQIFLKTGFISLIRPHPSVSLAAISNDSGTKGLMFSNGAAVLDELEGAAACVFVSSSVGAEAAYRRVPSVCLATDDLFGVNPVEGSSEVSSLASTNELIAWISKTIVIDSAKKSDEFSSYIYNSRSSFSDLELKRLFDLK